MAVESSASGEAAEYIDVLLLCAAPLDVRPALNLAVEVANFEAEVRRSLIPIRLRRVFPPTFEQLQRELSPPSLRQRTPRVFHFLGHGEEDYLWFEDELGAARKVTAAQLRRLFEGTPIRLALLNACWSATSRVKSLCQHLVEGAGLTAAIGHGKPVADISAIAFSRRFYAEITRGQSIRQAYFAGRNHLAENGMPGAGEIDLTGDGDVRLDEGLAPGERPGRVEDGMPTRGYLPGADFFCGRKEEFRQVAGLLADPNSRGFGVWGMGGIGKTALVKEAARRNAWRFRDGGVVFVDARDIAPATTAELLRRTLARLDPAARGDDSVFELVARLTAAPGLIVLDNLETLPESEYDALARFVGQVPRNGSHVLLTARAPIRSIAELPEVATLLLTTGLHEIDGAHYAHRFAETKGVALLRDDLPRLEEGQVRGLCAKVSRRVSGHPKMIEVAVGVARRGREELDRALDRLEGDLETRLEEMMATGMALVGDEGRRLLAFLPLFPAGNFMPEAMQSACAAAERSSIEDSAEEDDSETDADDLPWVAGGIGQLERGGFLELDQERNLLSFHQTLSDYAEQTTVLSPERSSAGFFCLLHFYAKYLDDNYENYEAIDRCLDNALKAMEMSWAARGEPGPLDQLLAEMVDALGYIFNRRGLWQLGERWNERAIAVRRGSDSASERAALAHELYRRAELLLSRGVYEEARSLHRESLELSEKDANLQGQATSLHALAVIERSQGNLDEARRLLQRSLAILEGLGDLRGEAACLHEQAVIERWQGNLGEARRLQKLSLGRLEGLGDLQGQAGSLRELGTIERWQGNPGEARRLLQRSLAMYEGLGDLRGQAGSLRELGAIESSQGNPGEARRLLQRSLAMYEGLGDLQGQAASLHELGAIESSQGNPGEARRLLQRSLAMLQGLGDLQGQAGSLHALGMIESSQGNPGEARRLHQRSLAMYEGLGDLQGQAGSLHALGAIESSQGNPGEARRLWERSLAIEDQIGNVDGRATTLGTLAQLEAFEGNRDRALVMARESVRLLEGIGSAKAATAREILSDLETADAGGSAEPLPFLAELIHLIERARAAGPGEGLAVVDAALEEARRESVLSREVVALLARSAVCWNAGDVTRCDENLQRAEEVLERVGEAERDNLTKLVEHIKAQRAQVTAIQPSASDRLYAEAMKKAEAGDMEGALTLFEASLAASRQEGDMRGVAVNLLMIGQMLLSLGRIEEARDRLREGLEVATDLGDESLLDALQEAATVAAAMTEAASVRGEFRAPEETDDVSER